MESSAARPTQSLWDSVDLLKPFLLAKIRDLLDPFCDLQLNNLDESLLGGPRVAFLRVPLRAGALALLGAPLRVHSGTVGRLTIRLPPLSLMLGPLRRVMMKAAARGLDGLSLADFDETCKIVIALEDLSIDVEPLVQGADNVPDGPGAAAAATANPGAAAGSSAIGSTPSAFSASASASASAPLASPATLLVMSHRTLRAARWEVQAASGGAVPIGAAGGAHASGDDAATPASSVGASAGVGGGSGAGAGGNVGVNGVTGAAGGDSDALLGKARREDIFLRLFDISVSRVHIRYIDTISDDTNRFQLGLIVRSLNFADCDDACCTGRRSGAPHKVPYSFFHKSLSWEDAHVYVSPMAREGALSSSAPPPASSGPAATSLMWAQLDEQSLQFLLRLPKGAARLTQQLQRPSSADDPPRLSADVFISSVRCEIREAQFSYLRALASYARLLQRRERYRKYARPKESGKALLSPVQAGALNKLLMSGRLRSAIRRRPAAVSAAAAAAAAAAASAALAAPANIDKLAVANLETEMSQSEVQLGLVDSSVDLAAARTRSYHIRAAEPLSEPSAPSIAPLSRWEIDGVSPSVVARIRERARGWWCFARDCVLGDIRGRVGNKSLVHSTRQTSEVLRQRCIEVWTSLYALEAATDEAPRIIVPPLILPGFSIVAVSSAPPRLDEPGKPRWITEWVCDVSEAILTAHELPLLEMRGGQGQTNDLVAGLRSELRELETALGTSDVTSCCVIAETQLITEHLIRVHKARHKRAFAQVSRLRRTQSHQRAETLIADLLQLSAGARETPYSEHVADRSMLTRLSQRRSQLARAVSPFGDGEGSLALNTQVLTNASPDPVAAAVAAAVASRGGVADVVSAFFADSDRNISPRAGASGGAVQNRVPYAEFELVTDDRLGGKNTTTTAAISAVAPSAAGLSMTSASHSAALGAGARRGVFQRLGRYFAFREQSGGPQGAEIAAAVSSSADSVDERGQTGDTWHESDSWGQLCAPGCATSLVAVSSAVGLWVLTGLHPHSMPPISVATATKAPPPGQTAQQEHRRYQLLPELTLRPSSVAEFASLKTMSADGSASDSVHSGVASDIVFLRWYSAEVLGLHTSSQRAGLFEGLGRAAANLYRCGWASSTLADVARSGMMNLRYNAASEEDIGLPRKHATFRVSVHCASLEGIAIQSDSSSTIPLLRLSMADVSVRHARRVGAFADFQTRISSICLDGPRGAGAAPLLQFQDSACTTPAFPRHKVDLKRQQQQPPALFSLPSLRESLRNEVFWRHLVEFLGSSPSSPQQVLAMVAPAQRRVALTWMRIWALCVNVASRPNDFVINDFADSILRTCRSESLQLSMTVLDKLQTGQVQAGRQAAHVIVELAARVELEAIVALESGPAGDFARSERCELHSSFRFVCEGIGCKDCATAHDGGIKSLAPVVFAGASIRLHDPVGSVGSSDKVDYVAPVNDVDDRLSFRRSWYVKECSQLWEPGSIVHAELRDDPTPQASSSGIAMALRRARADLPFVRTSHCELRRWTLTTT
jgi:Vacuolar sorting-associated protein 13, N-terminal